MTAIKTDIARELWIGNGALISEAESAERGRKQIQSDYYSKKRFSVSQIPECWTSTIPAGYSG